MLRELEAKGSTKKGYVELNQSCRTVFNYFDSIAIGLSQGLYVEDIVVEHLGFIMGDWRNRVKRIKDNTIHEFAKALPTHFMRFDELIRRWEKKYPDIVPAQLDK